MNLGSLSDTRVRVVAGVCAGPYMSTSVQTTRCTGAPRVYSAGYEPSVSCSGYDYDRQQSGEPRNLRERLFVLEHANGYFRYNNTSIDP